jgi:hypothetical protein
MFLRRTATSRGGDPVEGACRARRDGSRRVPDGLDLDEYDDAAMQVLGWVGEGAIRLGGWWSRRLREPTEVSCGLADSRRSSSALDYPSQPASSSTGRPKAHNREVLILWLGKHPGIFTALARV